MTNSGAFAVLQKIGKALMLPVSVLPIAGILLGIGAAKFSWLPASVSLLMTEAGGAVFTSMPLLFAIAVALSFADNDGVAALAAVVGYVIFVAALGAAAGVRGLETKAVMGFPSIDTSVFGGIIIGGVAGNLFKRYYKITLPPYLGFFAGKRFVPIVTGFAAIGTAVVFSFVWPPIGEAIRSFSDWAAHENPEVAFSMYGVVERSLIPFGLHHIWNVPFQQEVGTFVTDAGKTIHGEIQRFMQGDPTAGNLAGGYLFKMWGLPAAAIAIWRSARPEEKAKVGGIMLSGAITSFVTGITEPIEFSFLFVAPVLYGLHALLAGVAFYACIALGIKHGASFSHGLIDYIVLFPQSKNAIWLLVLGPVWAILYYSVFRVYIVRFRAATPGRETETAASPAATVVGDADLPAQLVGAFGGAANIKSLDACITRLRVELRDVAQVNRPWLMQLGAAGTVAVGSGMQAIFGPRSENLKTDMEAYLRSGGTGAAPPASGSRPAEGSPSTHASPGAASAVAIDMAALVSGLGGRSNIQQLVPYAATRLRVQVNRPEAVDIAKLRNAGVGAVVTIRDDLFHLIVGKQAEALAARLSG